MTTKIATALERISASLRAHPDKGREKSSPATATLEDGLRCRLIGPHGEKLTTDMPVTLGGGETAPSPGWFMRASLAACNATVIALRAAQCGINITSLEVTVSSEGDSRGMLGLDEQVSAGMDQLQVNVKISASGASAEEMRHLVTWAIAHSPVGCTNLASATLHVEAG